MTSTVSASREILPPEGCGGYKAPMGPLLQPEPQCSENDESELYSVSWNQDYGRFAAGTSHDFRIYSCLLQGQVRVEHFGLNITTLINAHDSKIVCLTLTMDGLLLATASERGTLIRIFNTVDGTRLQEVRRGADKADIYSIALSPDVQWLAVSSDKGTVHIFSLRVRGISKHQSIDSATAKGPALYNQSLLNSLDPLISQSTGANPGSSLSFMKGVLPKYFSSEWSFAQFHLPEHTRFTAAFGSQNTVIIVGMDGSFYRCSFDPVNGGEMVKQEHRHFLKTETGTR